MKNLFLLLIPFLIISCSDSEDENFNLVGEWNRTAFLENGINVIKDCEALATFNFKSNGNFVGVVYDFNSNGTCEESATINDTWELSENRLTFGSAGAVSLDIIDNNTIELSSDDTIQILARN